MKKIKCFLYVFAIMTAFFGIAKSAKAEDDISIYDWIVEAEIQKNGDLKITEDLSFEFNDKFNGVYRDIVLNKASGVTNIKVQEITGTKSEEYKEVDKADNGDNGVYTVNESKKKVIVKIYSPSDDEVKTFRISYTVKNVAVKYNDIAELYYKFLGSENTTAVGNLVINIYLPAKVSDNQVHVFAHGPLNGKIYKINDRQFQLKVQNVPRRKFIEGRILFPKELIALSDNTVDADMYSAIINEEEAYQSKLEADIAKKKAVKRIISITDSILIISDLSLFIYVLAKCRRKVKYYHYQIYDEMPADCTPATASLIDGHNLNSNTIFASVLDLFRKGYISISRRQYELNDNKSEDCILYKQKEADKSLLAHEAYLMNWLFNKMGNGQLVRTGDIEDYSKQDKSKFEADFYEWKKKVKEDAKKTGYYDYSKRAYAALFTVLSAVIIVLGIFAAVPVIVLSIVTGIALLIYGLTLFERLSDYGYVQYKRLVYIKNFIKYHYDFSQIDVNSPDVFLIYALALDTKARKTETYKSYDEDLSADDWMFWYILFCFDDNNSIKKSLDSSFVVVGSDGASSAGSFSGGGGGGAGGGGAGGF